MSDIATAYEASRSQFTSFAGLGGEDVPGDSVVDAMQVRLMRWQRRNFGVPSDEQVALGVIEELGEIADARTDAEVRDGVGDVIVYAGQLLLANRLAISSVLELAAAISHRGESMEPLGAAGRFAHCVLKQAQRIREHALGDAEAYRLRLMATTTDVIVAASEWLFTETEVGSSLARLEIINAVYLETGEIVLRRDWTKNRANGSQP